MSLRFSNIINGGQAGHYTVADFRMAFIFVAVVGLAHLYGYVRLAKGCRQFREGLDSSAMKKILLFMPAFTVYDLPQHTGIG